MPTWAGILVAVIASSFGVWLSWLSKRADQRKEDERKIETAPDDSKRLARIHKRVRELRKETPFE
jgi:hypothetical protein